METTETLMISMVFCKMLSLLVMLLRNCSWFMPSLVTDFLCF